MSSEDKKYPDTTIKNDADNTILISTDSEGFATWTLVTENSKNQTTDQVTDELQSSEVEDVKEAREDESEDDDGKSEETRPNDVGENPVMGKINNVLNGLKPSQEENSLDEFSDGISIISESESSGRLSPHPSLRQYLDEFSSKFLENSDNDSVHLTTPSPSSLKEPIVIAASALNTNSERQLRRRTRSSSSANSREQALQPVPIQKIGDPHPLTPLQTVRSSLKTVFYFGAILGLLGFVGRLFLPGWGSTASQESLEQLAQKLIDIELQNNLMRAEIDLLTKQVNYLNSLIDPTRKARNGQTSKPHDSDTHYKGYQTKGYQSDHVRNDTPEEFKNKPQSTVKTKTINHNIGQQRQEAEMKNRGNGELPINADNKAQQKSSANTENFYKRKKMEEKFNKDYSEHGEFKMNKEKEFKNSKEYLKDHRKNDKANYGNSKPNSRERHYKENDNNFQKKTAKQSFRDDFKERYDKKNTKNYSKDNIKERYESEGTSKQKSNSEWHENYMNNRANERHNNEMKLNDKNWFIERGSGREHMRYS